MPMNSSGGIKPSTGWYQRQRASTCTISRDFTSAIGWYIRLSSRPGLERVGQEAAEHEPAPHALVLLHRVELHGAPALLGQVHGDVGPLQEQCHIVAVLGCHGDAGTDGHGQRQAVHFDRTLTSRR